MKKEVLGVCQLCISLLAVAVPAVTFSAHNSPHTSIVANELSAFKALYKEKQYSQVIEQGHHYLKKAPQDVDVQYYVALSYYQLKQLPEARKNFQAILKKYPHYQDAIHGLAKVKKAQHQSSNPIVLEPQHHPIKYISQAHNQSIRDKPYYELMGVTTNAAVNIPNNIWDWSTLSLYRKNEYGAFGAGVNYANRYGKGPVQGFIEVQPMITDDVWVDAVYAHANNPNIFPDDTVVGEVYTKVGRHFVVSAGDGYRRIINTHFNTITGSIEAYISNYSISFRPNYYATQNGPDSTLYTIHARRYSENDPNQYIGIILASGTSPDLYDLLTVRFLKVKDQFALIEGQQPISDKFAFIYGGGYERQKFPSGFVRNLTYGTIGLKLRFE